MNRYVKIAVIAMLTMVWCGCWSQNVNGYSPRTSAVNNGSFNGHEYVDLGLPSGTLWATCNVGAYSPESIGGLFAWGETESKESYFFRWDHYKYGQTGYRYYTITKYCNDSECGFKGYSDNLTTLEPEDDAATFWWGSGWRTPTSTEWIELTQNTTWAWTSRNGRMGLLFTASNGQTLFLPVNDFTDHNGNCKNGFGWYWSSTLSRDNPFKAIFYGFCSSGSDYCGGGWTDREGREKGFSIRPVCSRRYGNTNNVLDTYETYPF